jgi:hypothetical protein
MNRRIITAAITALCVVWAAACATDPRKAYMGDVELVDVGDAALGGAALAQRKLELERALSDMTNIQKSLESMHDRRDATGVSQMRGFVNQYMVIHLNPLLAPTWQSSHPELILHDSTLRFVQAEVLMQLGYSSWVNEVINDMEERYEGRGNMLVEYPAGTQTTFSEALVVLHERDS